MDEMEMMAKKKALENIRGLAGDAMGNKLKALRPEPCAMEVAPGEELPQEMPEAEMDDEDVRRLMELYESREG
jgi:hypothetical protein